jgi:hypothetical protein
MLANGKQLLFLILHPSCYLYNQGVFDTTIRKQTQLTILHTNFVTISLIFHYVLIKLCVVILA